MNYGQKIAELRKKKKLTQAALGEKLNITAQAVSKWENNLSEPDIESLKQMCEIFGVSMDELLETSRNVCATTTENTESPVQQVKIINGYCEACKKPVGPGEYQVTTLQYTPNAITKLHQTQTQHLYCTSCYAKLTTTKQQLERAKKEQERKDAIRDERHETWLGLGWGIFACVLVAILGLFFILNVQQNQTVEEYLQMFLQNKSLRITTYVVLTVCSFTLVPQLVWSGDFGEGGNTFLGSFFFFFCRWFKWPFGFIFELSLDGIVWFLTVKLTLYIICGVLSIAFFIIGLSLSLLLSLVTFPFSLIGRIRETVTA